jgi:hypothetical protein
MKDTQNDSLGNHYCKTDVGTTVAMKDPYTLPKWLRQCISAILSLTANKAPLILHDSVWMFQLSTPNFTLL